MNERGLRIFIVEDEALVAFEMTDALEDLGFEVVGPSIHLEDAQSKARERQIDIAVLDVNLGPGKTSEPVARILDERGIPYVFLTAYDRDEIGFAGTEDRVLRKPVSARTLVSALHSELRGQSGGG